MDLTTVIPVNTIRNTLLITLLCACPVALASPMYKWVDEEGNVHYEQFAPTDRASEKLDSKSSEVLPPPQSAGQNKELDQPPPAVTEDEASRVKRQNCEAAKRNLDIYVRHNRIKQPDGSELVLSEEMREEKMRQAEEDIKQFCE